MRKIVLFCVLITVCMSGCFRVEGAYPFRQDADQIQKIEIRMKEYDSVSLAVPTILLKTLDSSEHRAFVEAVQAVPGNRLYTHVSQGIGVYQVWVYYLDGETEVFGAYNNGYVLPDGTWHLDCYIFDIPQFHQMLERFLCMEISE